jgi:hypothetical protein
VTQQSLAPLTCVIVPADRDDKSLLGLALASIWEEAMISEEFNKKTLAATDLALERAMSAPQ